MNTRFCKSLFIVLFILQTLFSCSENKSFAYFDTYQEAEDSVRWLYNWPPDSLLNRPYSGKEVAQRRALQMASLQWTPKSGDIPSRYGVYGRDITYTGIPYSLAIKTDSHLGTQVSLYTFMTAVNNPASVLYTEDLRKSPYNGFDCAPYYGTTCSNSVLFALGIEPPYYTYMMQSIPGIIKPKGQKPDDVNACDILLKTGHVVMVYDVEKDTEGNIVKVWIFETTSAERKDTWIKDYTLQEFRDYWEKNAFVRLQYEYLDQNTNYEPSLFIPLEDEPAVDYNRSLNICTTRGDRASFLIGEEVKIAVFTDRYPRLKLYRDGELFSDEVLTASIIRFKDLPYGGYKAYLSTHDGQNSTDFTSFEVLDAHVSGEKGNSIRIVFSSMNASPRYVCICDGNQNPYNYYQFDDLDRENGHYEMKLITGTRSTHFKVYFKGKYGIVSTHIMSF